MRENHLRARFHHGLGATYQRLGLADKAWVEYTAAAHHWVLAGKPYDAGCAENNVALLVAPSDRPRAYSHLERARGHFSGMAVKLAEVDETEARVRLGGRESGAALDLAPGAVRVFRRTGERALLLDALPTLIKAAADLQAELGMTGRAMGTEMKSAPRVSQAPAGPRPKERGHFLYVGHDTCHLTRRQTVPEGPHAPAARRPRRGLAAHAVFFGR